LGKIIIQLTPDSKSFLDIGCAYGFTVGYLMGQGIDAMGVDPSPFALAMAKQQVWADKIVEDSLPELKKIDRTFDMVFSSATIEHIPETEIPRALERMFELANKYLIITTVIGLPLDYDKDKTHISIKPREWWEETIRKAGMEPYRSLELENAFNEVPYCKDMGWSNHVLAFKK
jgi:SAM-dependent methyltransferase